MPKVPGFCGGTYQGRSVISDSQRCVNLYPEQSMEKNQLILIGSPGRTLWATLESDPAVCFHYVRGRVFVATLTTLYEVDTSATVTSRGSLLTAVGTGTPTPNTRIKISDNGIQLYITTGTTSFYYDLVLDTLTELDISAEWDGEFWDGYFVGLQENSQTMWWCGQYDAATWNALNFSSAEGWPDYVKRVLNSHRELVVFGVQSTEFFSHVGDPDNPLYPNRSAHLEYGIEATESLAKLDQCIYFIGCNEDSHALGIKLEGYQARIITPPAVSQAWASYSTIADAIGFGYTEDSHSFWVVTFPTADKTWVYDASINLWHERGYYDTATASWERDKPTCHVYAFGKHLVNDWETGVIYEQKMSTYTDNGDAIKRMRVFPHLYADNKRISFSSLALHADIDKASATVTLRYSDDGGETYESAGDTYIDENDLHPNRARWDQLGSASDRVFELTCSEAAKQVWIDAYINE